MTSDVNSSSFFKNSTDAISCLARPSGFERPIKLRRRRLAPISLRYKPYRCFVAGSGRSLPPCTKGRMSSSKRARFSQSSCQELLKKYQKLHLVYKPWLDERHLQEYKSAIGLLDATSLGSMKDNGGDKTNVSWVQESYMNYPMDIQKLRP
ncbi:uncharacterized protein A4U43_C05F20750 [Asparagus officinalis]|uniref:Uncharacterized protein n=1 Tax=Asparagus officinalis TaxID=4686 RepID=A0A5P1ETE1_ASPOF|nr:uncharacterized protein A4U43_C05F20750 [Asparagus officinalis]